MFFLSDNPLDSYRLGNDHPKAAAQENQSLAALVQSPLQIGVWLDPAKCSSSSLKRSFPCRSAMFSFDDAHNISRFA